ncbi:LOW QUALITY PROTEIN: hypothetical protein ACJ73_06640 [Blastomyces percursus]|uniref:Uncharacterized protein n=1 Tax=Blastomyces percursus TaxID=1658174 RepID=A0A1J9R0K7_9EURO|nr:LOW QUALITY PROTEIN: hypothetical protein ACJ73_06640 [Blastomyces percursus]
MRNSAETTRYKAEQTILSSSRTGVGLEPSGNEIVTGLGELPIVSLGGSTKQKSLRPGAELKTFERARGREIMREEDEYQFLPMFEQRKRIGRIPKAVSKRRGPRRIAELQETAAERKELPCYYCSGEKERRVMSRISPGG